MFYTLSALIVNTLSVLLSTEGHSSAKQALLDTRSAGENCAMSTTHALGAASLRERTAEEIRALLGRRRMSASALARELKVSQTYVWRRLSGETAFDLDDLDAIARILRVDPRDLMPAQDRRVTSTYSFDAVGGASPAVKRTRDRHGRHQMSRLSVVDSRAKITRPGSVSRQNSHLKGRTIMPAHPTMAPSDGYTLVTRRPAVLANPDIYGV